MRNWLLLLLILHLRYGCFADVSLPRIFGSHMVLQRQKPVPVWGWANPNETITVTLSGSGLNPQTKMDTAAADGTWHLMLNALEAGGPYQLRVTGKKQAIVFDDVLVGEVWVCSGQSNMAFSLQNATNGNQEVTDANYPTIRQLVVHPAMSLTPKKDVAADWSVCSPKTAGAYTAVGYFFARQLQHDLNVPIGLINTSWGGTHIETWISKEALATDTDLGRVVDKLPSTDEAISQSGKKRIQDLIEQQQGSLPTRTETLTWASPDTDTRQWKTMNVPTNWEWGGLPTVDGIVWLRRDIEIPEGSLLHQVTLQMGSVDDRDSTFVNGIFVGSTTGTVPRIYHLPEGLLKPGRNMIAVRVVDEGGAGGIMGQANRLWLAGDKLDIPLAGLWQYRIEAVFASSYKPGPNTYATQLFNAMINPLVPYSIAGVIWYQGEANTRRAYQYRKTFPLLIQDWRQHWGYAFPFLFVQLASYNAADGNSQRGSAWAELREAQMQTGQLPNTGMVVAADVGKPTDIHPKNKQTVGKRLAAEAMRVAYTSPAGRSASRAYSRGPVLTKLETIGNRVRLTFRYAAGGLKVHDRYGYVKGFEVAGADHRFYYANASIDGNSLIVHADSVANPVAVRYGWADDNGEINLYNKEGFPAAPFRTDSWTGVTEGVKFGDH